MMKLIAVMALLIAFTGCAKGDEQYCRNDQMVSKSPDGKVILYCHDCCDTYPVYYSASGTSLNEKHCGGKHCHDESKTVPNQEPAR